MTEPAPLWCSTERVLSYLTREDAFDIEFGTAERIVHKPALTVDRGDPDGMIGIYVVAEFKGGGNHVEWMSASEIWQLAKRSATYSHDQGVHTTGPWLTDYVEMAKKTVARRGSKWWPLTVDAAEAIGRDEEREIVVEADEGRTLALPSATSEQGILGTVRLVGVVVERSGQLALVAGTWGETSAARAWPWFVGRYGWLFDQRQVLATPIPCRGYQKLWTVEDDVAARLAA